MRREALGPMVALEVLGVIVVVFPVPCRPASPLAAVVPPEAEARLAGLLFITDERQITEHLI